MMKKRIVLITPMLQPYRLTFYSKLASYSPDLEWVIYHGVKKTEDGRPAFKGKTDFPNKGFDEHRFPLGPFNILVHKGLFVSLKTFDPDLIIIQGITGNLTYRKVVNWAHRRRKKIIVWTSGWEPGLASGRLLKFKNFLVSLFFRKADSFLAYSTVAADYIVERGISRSKVALSYNGIETDQMEAEKDQILKGAMGVRDQYQLNGFVTFIYVGGLLPEKSVSLLLDAFAAQRKTHQQIKLFIVGDGPLRNELLEKLNAMNDSQIYYLGRIIDEVDKYFAAADCLVLPGVGGLALNQAMFWEKVCIVSEADGTENDLIIDGITGFRFTKGDLTSLADAMNKVVLAGKDKLGNMGEAAREIIVTKSNVNNMVKVFIEESMARLSES